MQVELAGVTKAFGTRTVLNHISLTIQPGSTYALLGRNGAGKSTLLNLLLDLLAPDEGQVRLGGTDYASDPLGIRRQTGAVVENNPMVEGFSGRDYLQFAGRMHDLPSVERQTRIQSLADYFFENPRDLDKAIGGYSTGMRKRLALCAAVLHRPTLLILDEPFTGLDPLGAQQLVDFLQQYRSPERVILVSSHDLAYVAPIATHVGVLEQAQLVFNGTMADFTQGGAQRLDQSLLALLQPTARDAGQLSWLLP